MIKKCPDEKLGNSAWRIGLTENLCTPISNQLPSPAEILNSRIYKGYQPFLYSSSRPEFVTDKLVERWKEEIDLFQISQLLLKGKMFGIETMLRIFGKRNYGR